MDLPKERPATPRADVLFDLRARYRALMDMPVQELHEVELWVIQLDKLFTDAVKAGLTRQAVTHS